MAPDPVFAGGPGDGTLLLYIPVPLLMRDGLAHLEEQACNGLRLWADNFSRVIVMLPCEDRPPPPNWAPLARTGEALDRIEFIPLPTAWRADRFLRHYRPVRARIAAAIRRADYLSFAIGGLFGDWGAVACLEAHRLGRPFAVWTDRVESEVTRRAASEGTLRERMRARLTHRPMAWLERRVIERASLGLFHGRETFDAYAPFCRNPHLVHDIHIRHADHIPPGELTRKIAGCGDGPLTICYAGRAEPMKGALDWVEVMRQLARASVDFRAVWVGDGTERPEMQRRLAAGGLTDRIRLPGLMPRETVFGLMRGAHVFLFCHKTPESPRCLIEALVNATPIVGYRGAFAADLIAGHQGGLLTTPDSPEALADAISGLAADRSRLADLIARAARDGGPFDESEVFHHRSVLIQSLRPDLRGDPGSEAAPQGAEPTNVPRRAAGGQG